MLKTLLLLFFVTLGVVTAMAQERTVSGKVTDAEGEPVPGTSIVVKGTSRGTSADSNGNYTLEIPDNATLVYTSVGMATQEQIVGNRTEINVTLSEDIQTLEELVVTVPYGTVDRLSFTGSATQVGSKIMEKRTVTNIANSLAGNIVGLQVSTASGQPGFSPNFRIRGLTSISGSSAPLIVLDGVPYDQNLNNLNPNDIASISVLKDAASTNLYGSRAANGVIMVTTKKGRGAGRLNINYTKSVSSRGIPEYDRLGPKQYYTAMWEAYRNGLITNGGLTEAAANTKASNEIGARLKANPFSVRQADQLVNTAGEFNSQANLLYEDLNWEDHITRSGSRDELSLSYSGASLDKNNDYLLSASYLTDQGYLINSDFERWTTRLNINSKLKPWLKAGLNLSLTYVTTNNSTADGVDGSSSYVNPIRFVRFLGPIYPIYIHNEDGSYDLDLKDEKQYDHGNRTRPSDASAGRHAIQENLLNKDQHKRLVTSARNYVSASFLKNFTFKISTGVDFWFDDRTNRRNKYVGDGAPAGSAFKVARNEVSLTVNQTLNYTKTFNDQHNLTVLAGHESYSYVYKYFYGGRTAEVSDGNPELTNYSIISGLNAYKRDEAIESYFAKVSYDFLGKYFITLSARRDGSSKFLGDNKWGNFYAGGLAWRLENEDFLQNINWIDALKIRTSYGQTGNRSIDADNLGGYYPALGLYNLGYNNANEAGVVRGNIENKDLKWEKNTQFDVGLDFTLMGGKLYGVLEYFNRTSDDLLYETPVPLSSGIMKESVNKNIAKMSNTGYEVTLGSEILNTRQFVWDMSVNFTHFENEIKSLPVKEFISGTKKWSEGHSIYDYWLREYRGVESATGRPLYTFDPINTYSDTREVIQDGDTLTTLITRGKYGYSGKSAIPDFYGGFTNTFSYKNITLSIQSSFVIGGYMYDHAYQLLMEGGAFGQAMHVDALRAWRKPGDVTDVPRLNYANTVNVVGRSDRWLVSATSFTLRNVSLSYDLPRTILDKLKLASANVFVSGENLLITSKRKGLNPSQRFHGVTSNEYLPARIVSVGCKLSF